jgi:hypothetical protein
MISQTFLYKYICLRPRINSVISRTVLHDRTVPYRTAIGIMGTEILVYIENIIYFIFK